MNGNPWGYNFVSSLALIWILRTLNRFKFARVFSADVKNLSVNLDSVPRSVNKTNKIMSFEKQFKGIPKAEIRFKLCHLTKLTQNIFLLENLNIGVWVLVWKKMWLCLTAQNQSKHSRESFIMSNLKGCQSSNLNVLSSAGL